MKGIRALAGAMVIALMATAGSAMAAGEPRRNPMQIACPDLGNTEPAVDGFPQRTSSLVGADIRTGAHDCFERVVLELQGTGELPGYRVQYEPDPILESPSGEPVDIAGDATLVLSFGAWMTDTEGNGYAGPTEIVPTNVVNIQELEQIENHEGQASWAIGLDRERDFTVSTLTDPFRIVIDIANDVAAAPPTTTAPGAPPVLPPTR